MIPPEVLLDRGVINQANPKNRAILSKIAAPTLWHTKNVVSSENNSTEIKDRCDCLQKVDALQAFITLSEDLQVI